MPEKEKEQDSSARLVRRLAQLKSAFMKKLEETQKERELWTQCRWSTLLFDQVSWCFNEAKKKYDLGIVTNEELEMCNEESVWQKDYAGNKEDIEVLYGRMVEAVAGLLWSMRQLVRSRRSRRKWGKSGEKWESGGKAGSAWQTQTGDRLQEVV